MPYEVLSASPGWTWQQLTVSYTATATGRMGIHLKVPLAAGTSYVAYFDDVQVVPGPPLAQQTPMLECGLTSLFGNTDCFSHP